MEQVKAISRCSGTVPAPKMASYRGGYSCALDMTPDDSLIMEQAEGVGGFYSMVGWSGLECFPGISGARIK